MKPAIGFIGLGNMGLPMALNLVRAGYSVTVYNRTKEKAEPLIKEGARFVSRPLDVLSDGGVVITMVSNDQVLEEIVNGKDGFGQGLKPGHIHLSMSTVAPDTSKKLAAAHKEKGAEYLAAPVTGRPTGAQEKKLFIFLSGPKEAKEKVKEILQNLGQRTFDIGEEPWLGNIIKLCGNFLILSSVEAMAEAFTFAEKNGIERSTVSQVFSESIFACPVYQIYGPLLAAKSYTSGAFKLSLGLKDINLLQAEAIKVNMPMPLANLVHSRLISAAAKGRLDWDWCAIAQNVSDDAAK